MNLDEIYRIGVLTEYFRLCIFVLPPVKGEHFVVNGLTEVIEYIKKYNLCNEKINQIESYIKKMEIYKDNEAIKKEDAQVLKDMINIISSHIIKELSQRNIIELFIKSGLDANELIKLSKKEPSEYFLKETWDRLTDIEKSDISDAAKCLLLDSATPSVMVCLRGGEASIRNYYKAITGNDPGDKTWRQITQELKKDELKYGISDTFISYLDYLGDAKRNLAQHPNKIFTIREAAVIFMQIIAMIDDIYNQI